MKDNYFTVFEKNIKKEYKIIKAFKHKNKNYIIFHIFVLLGSIVHLMRITFYIL